MDQGNLMAAPGVAEVTAAVARLEARGVPRRTAMRRVARQRATTVRRVRMVASYDRETW